MTVRKKETVLTVSNLYVVMEVDYDGGRLGRCWRLSVCADKEAAQRVVEQFTKPIHYHDGERCFEPHVHHDRMGTIHGYRGPVPTFVYVEEKELLK